MLSSQSETREPGVFETPARRVTAVIPAFNEERFIASVVFQTRPFCHEVVVVDDGSSDRTAQLAEAAGARVIRLGGNRGKAEALNAGFQSALTTQSDLIVCLDADSQHEPAEIPSLLTPIIEGEADVVIGSRFLSVRSEIPRWRQTGQHALTAVTNTFSGTNVSDSQSGFRAFSAAAARAMRFSSRGLSVESEMQFLFGPAGLRIAEVSVSVRYQDGNKRNPVVHGLQVMDALLGMVARRRPLAFFALPGAAVGLLGFMLGLRVMLVLSNSGQLPMGTAILTAILLIGGLLLGVTGIMLHSVGHFVERLREEMRGVMTTFSASKQF